MRCIVDTNILISAGLFPKSVPATALTKALSPTNVAIICDYSLNEMHRIINKKFPHKANELELFLHRLLLSVELVSTPTDDIETGLKIRDIKDMPILRAAIKANADILLTGDKDFLESSIIYPRIMTATQFILIN
jgi:putative PIN family toxin of toxin-antitoxin system